RAVGDIPVKAKHHARAIAERDRGDLTARVPRIAGNAGDYVDLLPGRRLRPDKPLLVPTACRHGARQPCYRCFRLLPNSVSDRKQVLSNAPNGWTTGSTWLRLVLGRRLSMLCYMAGNSPKAKAIGAGVREVRKAAGLTQRQLQERLG